MTDLHTAAKQALEALEKYCTPYQDGIHPADEAITALRQALANEAIEKMKENAREIGLDYETVQTDWEAVAADQAMTIALLRAEQPAQGCDHCNHSLYAGTKCKNCGRVTEQAALKELGL